MEPATHAPTDEPPGDAPRRDVRADLDGPDGDPDPNPDPDPDAAAGAAPTGTVADEPRPAHHVDLDDLDDLDDDAPGRSRSVRRIFSHASSKLTLSLVLGVGGGLMLAETLGAMLSSARGLVVNIFVSLFLSFGLEPAVKWLHDRGMRRGAATGLVFVGVTVALVGFVAAMLPLVVDQVTNLVDNSEGIIEGLIANVSGLPGQFGDVLGQWLTDFQDDLPNRVSGIAQTASQGALSVGANLVGSVFNLLTIALITFYMTADAPRMRLVLSSRLSPRSQREFLEIWDVAIDKTGGYVYSRALTLVASAAFHIVAFAVIGLDYAVAMGAWVGVISSLVPVIGTYIAGILPVVIALSGDPSDVIWVVVALTIYQAAENYLIAPRITKHTLSLHPAVTFVSVLLGANLLGAFGALLAIPAAAIVAALFSASAEAHPHPVDDDEADRGSPPGSPDATAHGAQLVRPAVGHAPAPGTIATTSTADRRGDA